MSSKVTILIADDEAHIREVVKLIVSELGCEVVGEAQNGGEAVALFKKLKPDIILLDINMPMMTGQEALKEIINYDRNAYPVMLTSLNSLDIVKDCITSGAKNYILKDNAIEKMLNMVKESIEAYISSDNSTIA